jgi:hypothetical protein
MNSKDCASNRVDSGEVGCNTAVRDLSPLTTVGFLTRINKEFPI